MQLECRVLHCLWHTGPGKARADGAQHDTGEGGIVRAGDKAADHDIVAHADKTTGAEVGEP